METRAMLGNASEKATCVGAVFEVDATRTDILLVSFDRKTILGKPTVYVVMDIFSRIVAGYHVSLASESWFEAMVAIEHAATNKVENCARYGIQIQDEDWPCRHLPRNLIESNFHITNETVRQLLSGSTEARQLVRGDYNPARDSSWTIEEFNRFLIVYFMTYNKSALSRQYIPTKDMFADQVELTPLKVWNWDKGMRLLHEPQRKTLRYNLLPLEEAKVTRFGIEFRGLTYACNVGIEEGWFEGNGIYGKTKIEVNYDPRNCSSIFFKYKNDLLQCLLTGRSKEFGNLHFIEVEKIMKFRDSQIQEQEKLEKQHRAELHAFAEALDKSAKEMTKEATKDKSFYSRNQNKREVRKRDSKVWGAMGAMSNASSEPVSNLKVQMPNDEKLVKFPITSEISEQNHSSISDMQALFTWKSQERRRGNENNE